MSLTRPDPTLNYPLLNNISNFNPFFMRESEEPDHEGTLISLKEVDNETDLISIVLEVEGKLNQIHVNAEDLYSFEDRDLEELIGQPISIFRFAGNRGWDIWIVRSDVTHNDIRSFQDSLR